MNSWAMASHNLRRYIAGYDPSVVLRSRDGVIGTTRVSLKRLAKLHEYSTNTERSSTKLNKKLKRKRYQRCLRSTVSSAGQRSDSSASGGCTSLRASPGLA